MGHLLATINTFLVGMVEEYRLYLGSLANDFAIFEFADLRCVLAQHI
jgi:hypothetical protein